MKGKFTNVPNPDPDPPDPHVFGPGSTSQMYGSGSGLGSGSFYIHAKIVRTTLIPSILWLFLTFYLAEKIVLKISFLLESWRSMTKIAGSGSISQKHGSEDPDPDPPQNVMDPEHWSLPRRTLNGVSLSMQPACCGSMTFWCGFGSGSADPRLWLMIRIQIWILLFSSLTF